MAPHVYRRLSHENMFCKINISEAAAVSSEWEHQLDLGKCRAPSLKKFEKYEDLNSRIE
jgi:hypothetical protein